MYRYDVPEELFQSAAGEVCALRAQQAYGGDFVGLSGVFLSRAAGWVSVYVIQ